MDYILFLYLRILISIRDFLRIYKIIKKKQINKFIYE